MANYLISTNLETISHGFTNLFKLKVCQKWHKNPAFYIKKNIYKAIDRIINKKYLKNLSPRLELEKVENHRPM